MASCKFCGGSGWFAPLSKRGLCSGCEPLVAMDLAQRLRQLDEAKKAAESTLEPESKITRLGQLVQGLGALADYEKRGIEALGGEAARRLKASRGELDELILKTARRELGELFRGVRDTASFPRKAKALSGYLIKVKEYQARLGAPAAIEPIRAQVQELLSRVELSAELDAAAKAESSGETESARSHYRQALERLKACGEAGGPRERDRIEARLAALAPSGKPGKSSSSD